MQIKLALNENIYFHFVAGAYATERSHGHGNGGVLTCENGIIVYQ